MWSSNTAPPGHQQQSVTAVRFTRDTCYCHHKPTNKQLRLHRLVTINRFKIKVCFNITSMTGFSVFRIVEISVVHLVLATRATQTNNRQTQLQDFLHNTSWPADAAPDSSAPSPRTDSVLHHSSDRRHANCFLSGSQWRRSEALRSAGKHQEITLQTLTSGRCC